MEMRQEVIQDSEDTFNPPVIYKKAIEILKAKFTKEEWIEFCETLDNDAYNDWMEIVNEHVGVIAPEVFADPSEFICKEEVAQ